MSHLRESSEWNNMESALDFDLLAEYLLEDMGAGGFDFRYARRRSQGNVIDVRLYADVSSEFARLNPSLFYLLL